MKNCLLMIVVAAGLHAQAPGSPANLPPDTVVAKIGDHEVTVAEVQSIFNNFPPQMMQYIKQDPSRGLAAYYLGHYLAGEAEKRKLAEESPWKEQLAADREQVLANAMTTWERNNYQVPEDQMEAYYKKNLTKYQQSKIRAIKIDFKPGAAPSVDDLKKAAEDAMTAAHTKANRTEAEAKALAAELVKKLRAGGDFAALAKQYSDDEESKGSGGDFGVVKANGPYPPAIKNGVAALNPGQISEPVPVSNSFYILRVEERSAQSFIDAHEDILQTLREAHMGEYITSLRARFLATVLRPDFFAMLSAGAAPKK
jgi:foldase protein PrsA